MNRLNRRRFLKLLPMAAAAPHTLIAQFNTQPGGIDTGTLEAGAKLAGLSFTPQQRDQMMDGVKANLGHYEALRKLAISNEVAPAYFFDPKPSGSRVDLSAGESSVKLSPQTIPTVSSNLEELAFASVAQLSELIRLRMIRSVELTNMYLDRLKKYDPSLQCVITLCEDLAMKQARRADEELANGMYRGPLHGIPWGAKDLLAVKEYRTTWGAEPYKDQLIYTDATVVQRLEQAGAVLLAKLSMGETARGETWFAGVTKNPWNLKEGAQGSSAGPAAATSAGLVGFAIGSDTRGSITLPCDRCGASGLRPTFGTVSRYGAMVLAWTMDKLGPICRTMEDCVLVLLAIRGTDGKDGSVRFAPPLNWDSGASLADLRVGYVKAEFERPRRAQKTDDEALQTLKSLGVNLLPIEIPKFPLEALRLIMDSETGAAFDELVVSGRADLLAKQGKGDRPNNLRYGELIPAVEYIQANRARTILMTQLDASLDGIDVLVAPSLSEVVLMLTNLTGHPSAVVPNGFIGGREPTSISFIGGLYKDSQAALLAHHYQQATDFHRRHPDLLNATSVQQSLRPVQGRLGNSLAN
jgi:Asp-tRNA(Asn)/Glu-tRNA(Gln) amidotransferase A subunit family amidase